MEYSAKDLDKVYRLATRIKDHINDMDKINSEMFHELTLRNNIHYYKGVVNEKVGILKESKEYRTIPIINADREELKTLLRTSYKYIRPLDEELKSKDRET